jgi:hypothetical protein
MQVHDRLLGYCFICIERIEALSSTCCFEVICQLFANDNCRLPSLNQLAFNKTTLDFFKALLSMR